MTLISSSTSNIKIIGNTGQILGTTPDPDMHETIAVQINQSMTEADASQTLIQGVTISNTCSGPHSNKGLVISGKATNVTIDNCMISGSSGLRAGQGVCNVTISVENSVIKNTPNAAYAALQISGENFKNEDAKVVVTLNNITRVENIRDGGAGVTFANANDLTLNVNGATILGGDSSGGTWGPAILMTAGNLNINGGTISGFGDFELEPTYVGNYTFQVGLSGSGVEVAPGGHGTDINIKVSGGTITSQKGNAIQLPDTLQNSPGTSVKKPNLEISGGTFEAYGSQPALGINSEAQKIAEGSITSGTFSSPVPNSYLSSGTKFGFIGQNSKGDPVYGYYSSLTASQNAASAANPSNPPQQITVQPGSSNAVIPTYYNLTLFNISSGTSVLNYYNTGTKQEQVTGMSLFPENIGANALNFTVSPINNINNVPTFNSANWTTKKYNNLEKSK